MTATVCKFDEPTPTRYERKAWKFMERLQRKCCLLIAVWSMFCFWVSFCSAAHDLDNFVIGLTKINDNPANTVPLKSCYAFCGQWYNGSVAVDGVATVVYAPFSQKFRFVQGSDTYVMQGVCLRLVYSARHGLLTAHSIASAETNLALQSLVLDQSDQTHHWRQISNNNNNNSHWIVSDGSWSFS